MGPSHQLEDQLPQTIARRERFEIDSDAEHQEDLHDIARRLVPDVRKGAPIELPKGCAPHSPSFTKSFADKGISNSDAFAHGGLDGALKTEMASGLPQLQDEAVGVCAKSPSRSVLWGK